MTKEGDIVANRQEFMAVGENCPDFDQESNFVESSLQGAKSCEICSHWDHSSNKCKIDMYDKVVEGLDQT
jgi:hypothetical protein